MKNKYLKTIASLCTGRRLDTIVSRFFINYFTSTFPRSPKTCGKNLSVFRFIA